MNKIKILLKILVVVIMLVFGAIYGITYVMKDRANGEDVREICTDIWEGPQNVANLLTSKLSGKMYFNTQKNRKSEEVDINKILEQQKNIEHQIEKEYSELEYTWRHPYIKVNPYGTTPLSALIKFKTDEPMKVKIEIVDREGTNIEYNFDEYVTEHEYGVSGLYLTGETEAKLYLENEIGTQKSKKVRITPKTFNLSNDESVFLLKNDLKETNLYLIRGYNNGTIIDNFGNIRGIRKNYYFEAHGHILLKNKNYLNSYSSRILGEENEVGKILKIYNLGEYSYHHHALEMENGNLLLAVNKEGATKIDCEEKIIETVEDHIIEIDRNSGKIIKEWDIGDILDVNRLYQGHGRGSDWFHMNSFIYDKKDNSLVISGNFQGVIKIDYKTGKLKWIMAYHKKWGKAGRDGKGEELNKYLLYATDKKGNRYSDDIQSGNKIIEEFRYPVGQHDLSWVGENKILMFDNKRLTAPVYENNQKARYSKAVIYEIDEKNMNVKEIWSFGEEIGVNMYSPWVSSAEENENTILIGAGAATDKNNKNYGRILIVDKRTKKVKLEVVYFSNYTAGGSLGAMSFYQVNRLK